MTSLPNFTTYGYQVIEQLSHNVQGGRITYKALEIATNKLVVIKQFRFATTSDWDSYKQIEREIEVLQGLSHAGIPQYLTQFDPHDGLCLVQEYKEAQPLSKRRSFSPEDIKSIAIQLLEILVYLQERIPPIFHRDIKPENVLVSENPLLQKKGEMSVYLIDFGLARIGNSTMAFSSMMGGTLGFMPPEQLHNQKLTEASDLYSLGATLIGLITQTKSSDIGSLVDFATNKITFKNKVTKFSLRFIQWLEKMVEPNPTNRYQNAKSALKALHPLDLIRIPEVRLDKLELNFVANSVGQKLSQTITVTNNIPDTILQGKWSVSAHESDPPHTPDSHSWISFSPREFKGNQVDCLVKVDTSQLKADKDYEREIVLISNARQESYYVKVKVETAPIEINVSLPPYGLIVASGLLLAVISGGLLQGFIWLIAGPNWEMIFSRVIGGAIVGVIGGIVLGAIWGGIIVSIDLLNLLPIDNSKERITDSVSSSVSLMIGLAISMAIVGAITGGIGHPMGVFVGMIIVLIGLPILVTICKRIDKAINKAINKVLEKNTYISILLVALIGILTGIVAVIGFNPYFLTVLTASALPLVKMLIYPPLKSIILKAQYRRQESQNLIEP